MIITTLEKLELLTIICSSQKVIIYFISKENRQTIQVNCLRNNLLLKKITYKDADMIVEDIIITKKETVMGQLMRQKISVGLHSPDRLS